MVVICVLTKINAQTAHKHETYIKGNMVSALFAVPNFGIETSLGEKTTFQVDVIASFWESVGGQPLKFCVITPEYRYYFTKKFDRFYLGAHVGGTTFNLSKFFRNNDGYQKGLGYIAGITFGFYKKINDTFSLDFFIGGGTHQAFYKGYKTSLGQRWDGAKKYNKSGEWLPYRGGVMLVYKLHR
jgi:hypothetical protein